jgi:hypothetical protein
MRGFGASAFWRFFNTKSAQFRRPRPWSATAALRRVQPGRASSVQRSHAQKRRHSRAGFFDFIGLHSVRHLPPVYFPRRNDGHRNGRQGRASELCHECALRRSSAFLPHAIRSYAPSITATRHNCGRTQRRFLALSSGEGHHAPKRKPRAEGGSRRGVTVNRSCLGQLTAGGPRFCVYCRVTIN